jgi:3D (Asp-Asp-Asp) domain-containing protein
MKYFLGGSAVLTTAFLTASFALYVPTSVAIPRHSGNDNKRQQTQDKKQEQTNNHSTQNDNKTKDNVAGLTETKDKKDADTKSTDKTENKGETKEEIKKEETKSVESTSGPLTNAERFTATAYSLRGRTATGRGVSKGIIAADPRVLPLGSKVRIEAGNWSGEYLVADTGGKIKGKRIDIWVPSSREAMRFGRRAVKLTVLTYGVRRTKSKQTSTANKARSAADKTEKKK